MTTKIAATDTVQCNCGFQEQHLIPSSEQSKNSECTESAGLSSNSCTATVKPKCTKCGSEEVEWVLHPLLHQPQLAIEKVTESEQPASLSSNEYKLSKWQSMASVLPGLILLLPFGLQNIRSIFYFDLMEWESPMFNASLFKPSLPIEKVSVLYYCLAIIVGILTGGGLINILRKKTIYTLCALIQLATGISEFFTIHDFYLAVTPRILSGVALGITYLALTVHISDTVCPVMRKTLAKWIAITLAISNLYFAIQFHIIILSHCLNLLPIHLICIAVLGLASNVYFTRESIPYFLTRKREKEAMEIIVKQGGTDACKFLDKLKAIATEEKLMEKSFRRNVRVLLIVIAARLACGIISNPLYVIYSVRTVYDEYIRQPDAVLLIYWYLIEIIIGGCVISLSSRWGRHRFVYVLTTVFSIIFLLKVWYYVIYPPLWTRFLYLQVLYVLLLAFSANWYQQLLTTEAFSVTRRVWFVVIAMSAEYSVPAVTYYTYDGRFWEKTTLYLTIIVIVASIVLVCLVSKTLNLSLSSIRKQFTKDSSNI